MTIKEISAEIRRLKLIKPQTKEIKFAIQKLQQQLDGKQLS
jgi:hypothetical protein|tara:strand:+ start:870 stop:992 length:123 start_codon:yes stop_codon:yes gene_type:complete